MLLAADAARRDGRWQEAEQYYLSARNSEMVEPELIPRVDHNLALCALVRGDFQQGARYSLTAMQAEPALWVAALVHAKCQRGLGNVDEARGILEALRQQLTDASGLAAVNGELADILLNDYGDPQGAMALQANPGDPGNMLDAELTRISSGFYDGERAPAETVRLIGEFARKYLNGIAAPDATRRSHNRSPRRVGLISPFFSRSPVYFLCIGVLARLAQMNELVFFSRTAAADQATAEFRQLATEWHDCAGQDATSLQRMLAAADLDVLIDLGGWSDVLALQALAGKPAPVLYKWVGGQSATTGMTIFDGFITDSHQSPQATTAQHTEPLAWLEHGYVTYTPPSYLPAPRPAAGNELVFGIVANPAKISAQFLGALRAALPALRDSGPVRLRMIDRRMQIPAVVQRLRAGLGALAADTEFVAPRGHDDYLREVAQLTAVLDTFPYSSGLTALEALAMGVPIVDLDPTPVEQRLFCGRHAYAHGHFARQGANALPPWMRLTTQGDLPAALRCNGQERHSYLTNSPRLDHDGVATDIQHLFNQTGTR